MESGIHDVESRIQECLGFSYMGRKIPGTNGNSEKVVPGAFHLGKKTPKFRWEQKWNFRLVISCSPLVLNPGTSRCPTVDLELVQTTRNVNGTRHSVRKFQPGKRAHLFRFSTFSGNFPVGRADETCSIYRRTRNSGNFD